MKRYIIAISFLLVAGLSASADEGMWMVNAISKALVQKMENKGLKLKAREIYSEDAVSLKDAIVSLDFGCSGSLISPNGLLFTNHHCVDFNKKLDAIQGDRRIVALGHEYAKKLYEKRLSLGQLQYPDANSAMRLTYGTVGGYSPRDGVYCSWTTNTTGILEKEKPGDFDFSLKDDWKVLLTGAPSPIPVNFLTDNDITGGNSGSAVLNARDELIGLAFDGNKESLASDKNFTPGYNKCVCVDIRYVLWILRNYIKPGNLLDEINIK